MILCNHCIYFNKKDRFCISLVLDGRQLRVPNKIKDVKCTSFKQSQFHRDVVLQLKDGNIFSYNLK